MTQVREVKSEELQATIRRLLPSQGGFSEDLQATNLITPIIDLTPAAEGNQLREDLQTAYDRAVNQTSLAASSSATLSTSIGFEIVSGYGNNGSSSSANVVAFELTDGFTTTRFYEVIIPINGAFNIPRFVVYNPAGFSLTASTGANISAKIYNQQIADSNGQLQNPTGYNPQ